MNDQPTISQSQRDINDQPNSSSPQRRNENDDGSTISLLNFDPNSKSRKFLNR